MAFSRLPRVLTSRHRKIEVQTLERRFQSGGKEFKGLNDAPQTCDKEFKGLNDAPQTCDKEFEGLNDDKQ